MNVLLRFAVSTFVNAVCVLSLYNFLSDILKTLPPKTKEWVMVHQRANLKVLCCFFQICENKYLKFHPHKSLSDNNLAALTFLVMTT